LLFTISVVLYVNATREERGFPSGSKRELIGNRTYGFRGNAKFSCDENCPEGPLDPANALRGEYDLPKRMKKFVKDLRVTFRFMLSIGLSTSLVAAYGQSPANTKDGSAVPI